MSTTETSGRIEEAVEACRNDLVDLTIDFCRIAAENPPGRGLVESQQWIGETLSSYGIEFEIHDTSRADTDHRTVIGSIGDDGPSVYLHGHYDVVPAFTPTQFEPEVRDGSIHGRGTSDMKGGLIAMLIAAVIHRDLDGAGQLKLMYVPDEESGGADGAERLTALGLIDPTDCVGAIVAEPSYPDIWYAARGAFTVEVAVHGRPAHVGLHYNGINALEQAHGVIGELMKLREAIASRKTTYRIEPEAARSSIMLIGGTSTGGTNFNIVPDRFTFTIDRRPNPDEDYEQAKREVLDKINELGEHYDISFDILQDVHPADSAIDDPFVQSFQETIARVSGRHAELTMCPGCLETRIYSRIGIPSVAYGPGPMAEMHEPSERLPIANLTEATRVVAEILGTQLGYTASA